VPARVVANRSGIIRAPLYPYTTVALPVDRAGSYAGVPRRSPDSSQGAWSSPRSDRGGAPARFCAGSSSVTASRLLASPYAGCLRPRAAADRRAQQPYEYVLAVEPICRGVQLQRVAAGTRGCPGQLPRKRRAPATPRPSFSPARWRCCCRMGGVPSECHRLRPVAYTPSRGEYGFRDNDSHSCSRPTFETYGWVPFDPTPPADRPSSQSSYGRHRPRAPRPAGHRRRAPPAHNADRGDSPAAATRGRPADILAVAALVAARSARLASCRAPAPAPRRSPREPLRRRARAGVCAARAAPHRPDDAPVAVERHPSPALPSASSYLRALGAYRFASGGPDA